MVGYRNIVYNPRNQEIELMTWDEDGIRIQTTFKFKPYLMFEHPRGTHTSIFNTPLQKRTFESTFDRNRFVKESGVVRLFENIMPTQQFLIDTFWEHNESTDFDRFPLKTYFVDIECPAQTEFPNAKDAKYPITVITLYCSFRKKYFVWGLGDFKNSAANVEYINCKTERDLLEYFIEFMRDDPCDVLSGWNSTLFDFPYIINRIKNIFGDAAIKRLSPCGNIYSRTFPGKFGKEETVYHIDGISIVDYLDIYKRFKFVNQPSYRLNEIASSELGEAKIDYGDMDLFTLMNTDWQKFVDYNIKDVELLVKLDDKLKYLNLLRMLAYTGLTTIEGALGTLSGITGAIAIKARKRKQCIPTFVRDGIEGKIPGAYVAEPKVGFNEKVVSYDANSLYPNLMISLNMSPETKVGKIVAGEVGKVTIKHTNGESFTLTPEKFAQFIKSEQIAISRAKILFSQKTKGIVADFVDGIYKKRVEAKRLAKVEKKKIATFEDIEKTAEVLEKINKSELIISRLDSLQMTQKILINSVFGYFGNKQAPLGDDDIGSSITLTGQAVIKQGTLLAEEYISNVIGRKVENILTQGDTDSLYLSVADIFIDKNLEFTKNGKLTKDAYKYASELNEHLNKNIALFMAQTCNSIDSRIEFKREIIADVVFPLAKKRYVAHVLDDEGIPCNKWKYVGVDVVRTSMPKAIKPHVKGIIETMITSKSQSDTNESMQSVYETFCALSIEDIAKTSNISNYEMYASRCSEFSVGKRTPCHVKAAYFHNLLLEQLGLIGKYEKIQSGDKIKYVYLKKPNKYGIDCIAFKYKFPEEFKVILVPDSEKMFEKIVYAAIENFYLAVNWTPRKPSEAVQADLFDLFG